MQGYYLMQGYYILLTRDYAGRLFLLVIIFLHKICILILFFAKEKMRNALSLIQPR
jgi:hypothetical protein